MARNFYKKDGSYYYSDNNQKILNIAELKDAASAGGIEVAYEGGGEAGASTEHDEALNNHPEIKALTNGGSPIESIVSALESGDWSGIVDWDGQPFSAADQESARVEAQKSNELYYNQLREKETADAESSLAQQQANYQNYLINSGQQFEADKTRSDQKAADQGVLFSGSRVQKEKNLTRAYEQDQATAQRNMTSNIGNTARDFQYKYGNKNAQGLSQYYNLGGNTYNANKARGGVGSSGLSSVYNPDNYSYDGRRNVERSTDTNTRAAGSLWNKGNKLLASGYNNQY